MLRPVAQDAERHGVPRAVRGDHLDEVLGRVHGLAVHGDDDVAVLHAGALGGAVRADLLDEGALLARELVVVLDLVRDGLDLDRERAARDLAVGDELVEHRGGRVDRKRESDALDDAGHVAAAALVVARDRGVDADDLAARVHERTAGIAEVDGRVGLDVVREARIAAEVAQRASLAADDADGDGVLVAERVADRDDPFTGAQAVGVAHGERGEVVRPVDLEKRDVERLVLALHGGGELLAVLERHGQLPRAGDDVVIGQDVTVLADEEPGPGAVAALLVVVTLPSPPPGPSLPSPWFSSSGDIWNQKGNMRPLGRRVFLTNSTFWIDTIAGLARSAMSAKEGATTGAGSGSVAGKTTGAVAEMVCAANAGARFALVPRTAAIITGTPTIRLRVII
jgi:acetyltransferase-like isoleucine patch superfamily enzyme